MQQKPMQLEKQNECQVGNWCKLECKTYEAKLSTENNNKVP